MNRAIANELTVCFWNVLFDASNPSQVKSQSDRLPDIVKTLQSLPSKSIIGLAEVEGSNGKSIANHLGSLSTFFVEHHKSDDYIGVVSSLQLKPKFIQVDETCKAVICEYRGLTVVIVHLTLEGYKDVLRDALRRRQIQTILNHIGTSSPVVILGDFNSMYWQGSRSLFKRAGFRSALGRSLSKRLPTAPTKNYRRILPEPLKTLGRSGFSLDDIYIKGVELLDSGTFEGESDHLGVRATLRWA